ncbi:GGDEF domain-containing protein [Hellea balneolensis]|uniref:GGDEF domain-containing protein n=1 Tax=Hellea balneolensis TaxID=287478 RepID=UPI00040D164C|nr:diguanylate cyclase [Hellea balneolensis]
MTVLIATDNMHESSFIGDSLASLGYEIKFCEFDGNTLKGTPVAAPSAVLFVFTDYIEKTPLIINALKSHFASKNVPFIGALTRPGNIDSSIFDSVIFPPAHITQIANRVSSIIRLGQMEREIIRRVDTLRESFDIDYTLSDDVLSNPFRILFIGKATPDFMVIINSLQKKNVEVVAAFTSFSAFDYLHERTFDAVVMNALQQSEPALTISDTMRRNARLFHVPTLFLVNKDTFQDHDLAYKKGARDILYSNADTQEISGRILELANYHRIHDQLKTEFSAVGGEKCIDTPSGVFNKAFFKAHMHRVCENMKSDQEPLALLAVSVKPNAHFEVSEERISNAISQVGTMLKNLVRMQDITARLDANTFAIAFPGQNHASVSSVLKRISAIVDCAAFDSGDNENGAFTVSLETALIDMMPHENSETLIETALSELNGEPVSFTKISA